MRYISVDGGWKTSLHNVAIVFDRRVVRVNSANDEMQTLITVQVDSKDMIGSLKFVTQ